MVRALLVVLAFAACTPAQAPMARKVGKVLALGGVIGLIASSASAYAIGDNARPAILVFSATSTVGIVSYAAGDLSAPRGSDESIPERNQRWARILTDRAHGYARTGLCRRVRHIETRVRVYDRVLHEGVFMRDPEIQKCMANEPPPAPEPEQTPAVPPSPTIVIPVPITLDP